MQTFAINAVAEPRIELAIAIDAKTFPVGNSGISEGGGTGPQEHRPEGVVVFSVSTDRSWVTVVVGPTPFA
jgi:hypothetical protein